MQLVAAVQETELSQASSHPAFFSFSVAGDFTLSALHSVPLRRSASDFVTEADTSWLPTATQLVAAVQETSSSTAPLRAGVVCTLHPEEVRRSVRALLWLS